MSEPGHIAEVDLSHLRLQVEGLNLKEAMGSGAYWVIFGVTVNGKKCVAKKPHKILLQKGEYGQSGEYFWRKFCNECYLMSQLNHPNVVGFVGVHYHNYEKEDISLILERLHCDLGDFLWTNPDSPLSDRLHILHDVSKGLDYLHSLSPPLIHRDLTVSNIFLTEDLVAKIGDLGESSYVDPEGHIIRTSNPEHFYYIPPEWKIPSTLPRWTYSPLVHSSSIQLMGSFHKCIIFHLVMQTLLFMCKMERLN